MSDTPDRPALELVPDDPAPDAPDASEASPPDAPEPDVADPLLERADAIAELPLSERPAAFDALNRAVVAELNTLEEG